MSACLQYLLFLSSHPSYNWPSWLLLNLWWSDGNQCFQCELVLQFDNTKFSNKFEIKVSNNKLWNLFMKIWQQHSFQWRIQRNHVGKMCAQGVIICNDNISKLKNVKLNKAIYGNQSVPSMCKRVGARLFYF